MATAPLGKLSPNPVSHAIISAAMRVHTELGPGLLESTYSACLQYELSDAGCRCFAQVGLPVVYRGVELDLGYRMDLVVEDLVIAEIKSVDAILQVHQAQLLSYLKLSGKSLGLLINFNVVHLKDGIKRFVKRCGVEVKAIKPQRTRRYTGCCLKLSFLSFVVKKGFHGNYGNAEHQNLRRQLFA